MRIGILLILFSGLAFALMLIIPFLELENKFKVIGSSAAFIAMEVLFWSGSLLVGKEIITKYKAKLNPKKWFRSKDNI